MVLLPSCPIHLRAPQLTQDRSSIAYGSTHPVHEHLLPGVDFARPRDHPIRRRPVQHQGTRFLVVQTLWHADEILLRHIDQLGLRIVNAEASHHITLCRFAHAVRSGGDNGADEVVARGQRGGFLHRVAAETHVDVTAAEARVEYAHLDMFCWWGLDGGGDDGDMGFVAVGGDEGFAYLGGHFVEWSFKVYEGRRCR